MSFVRLELYVVLQLIGYTQGSDDRRLVHATNSVYSDEYDHGRQR